MMIVAIQTSRSASVGVPKKNLLQVLGRPLYQYGLEAALNSKRIRTTIAASDIPEVLTFSESNQIVPFSLPPDIANGNHYGAIRAAAIFADSQMDPIDAFVILLGNALGATAEDLDSAIGQLEADDSLDSIASVSSFSMFNPLRAFRLHEHLLQPIASPDALDIVGPVNERNAVGGAWFFNGSFWVIRRKPLLDNDGPPPYPWLGNKIGAFCQPALMELDESWQIPLMPYLFRSPRSP